MGGSRGAVRAPVRPWRPSVGAVARRGPRRLGDRRWGRPRAWFAAGVDASATGGGLSRSDKLHATGASAARRARPGRATTRLMRPPPFAVGSGRRTSRGVRTPAVIHQQAVECGQRNPSLGERPAVSKGSPAQRRMQARSPAAGSPTTPGCIPDERMHIEAAAEPGGARPCARRGSRRNEGARPPPEPPQSVNRPTSKPPRRFL